MFKLATALLPLLPFASLTAQDPQDQSAGHANWIADFDEAAAAAKKAGKDMLVDFTGSDWCIWCKRLDEQVFSHKEFLDGVKDHFVLVSLDFPNGEEAKAKVPNPKRNQELMEKYGVKGFPTVLLMSPDGEVYGRTGYQRGGPVKYVESLDKMRTEGKKNLAEIKALVAEFAKAEADAREMVLGKAIEKLAKMQADAVGIDQIAKIVGSAVATADAAVQVKALEALLKSGQADEKCQMKAAEIDPKNEKGLFELTVESKMMSVSDDKSAKAFLAALDQLVEIGAKDADRLERMLGNAARWSFGPLKNKEAAVKYAKLLKEHAKDAEKYADMLTKILGDG